MKDGTKRATSWDLTLRLNDLLFLHWPVAEEDLRPLVPAPLSLDTFDGSAWIGLVALRMDRLRRRYLPPVPGARSLLELNVRTYVRHDDRPGVYFLSIFTGHRLAALFGRRALRLPFAHADIRLEHRPDGRIRFACRAGDRELDVTYGPTAEPRPAAPGSREHFLTERYVNFLVHQGTVREGAILHEPWPLQPATAEIARNTMLPMSVFPHQIETEPHLLFVHAMESRVRTPRPL